MRPEILLVLSLSSLLPLSSPLCVPRTSYHPLGHHHSHPPSPSPSPVAPSALPGIDILPPVVGIVRSICGHTDYPDVCLSTLHSLILTLKPVTPASVLSLHIDALRSLTKTVRALAAKLASNPDASELDKSSYSDAVEFYDEASDNIDAAAKALAAHDKGTLNSMLSALIDNYGDVEDEVGMEEPSPLTPHDAVLTKMTSNSLAIATLV